MSTGERVARQYRGLSTGNLRQLLALMRNERRKAAVRIVLTEREEAYQRGEQAANLTLTISGQPGQNSWMRAVATLARAERAGDWDLHEMTQGWMNAVRDRAGEQASL